MPDGPAAADAGRFEAFVREYQDLVFGTALRLVGSPAEAEDVAQSVFLKAYERWSDVGGNPSAPGWLRTVTRNLALNHLTRYRRRWQFFSEMDEAPDVAAPYSAAAVAAAPEFNGDRPDDRLEALEAALHALPDHQRVPLVLFHFEEMSYHAIAVTLGVSLAKVKTDIHRGRHALRSALGAGHAK